LSNAKSGVRGEADSGFRFAQSGQRLLSPGGEESMTMDVALSGREDVSRFMVHLTRDDRDDYSDGASARANLRSILSEQRIRALSPHCTFNRKLAKLPDKIARRSTRPVSPRHRSINSIFSFGKFRGVESNFHHTAYASEKTS
jgi:hypothetical protein